MMMLLFNCPSFSLRTLWIVLAFEDKDAVLDAMRSQLYKIYGVKHEQASQGGSTLLTQEKYDKVVDALIRHKI